MTSKVITFNTEKYMFDYNYTNSGFNFQVRMGFLRDHKEPTKHPMGTACSRLIEPMASLSRSNVEDLQGPGVDPGIVPGNCRRRDHVGSICDLPELCSRRKPVKMGVRNPIRRSAFVSVAPSIPRSWWCSRRPSTAGGR